MSVPTYDPRTLIDFTEIKPTDPAAEPKVPLSPKNIWGNVLIGFGCLFGLNGLIALGAGRGRLVFSLRH
jgi:hypothetical protein